MIVIIDYGMGNLRSVQKALESVGHAAEITSDPDRVRHASKVVLPGVGAFADAIAELRRTGLGGAFRDAVAAGKPCLGVCLGLQLLFDVSEEDGLHEGLGLLPGRVVRFESSPGLKIPHMGWNTLEARRTHPLLEGVTTGDTGLHAYFVHSYALQPADPADVVATTEYGGAVTAVVGRDNMAGTQFHPEKSQTLGLRLIANFLRWRP